MEGSPLSEPVICSIEDQRINKNEKQTLDNKTTKSESPPVLQEQQPFAENRQEKQKKMEVLKETRTKDTSNSASFSIFSKLNPFGVKTDEQTPGNQKPQEERKFFSPFNKNVEQKSEPHSLPTKESAAEQHSKEEANGLFLTLFKDKTKGPQQTDSLNASKPSPAQTSKVSTAASPFRGIPSIVVTEHSEQERPAKKEEPANTTVDQPALTAENRVESVLLSELAIDKDATDDENKGADAKINDQSASKAEKSGLFAFLSGEHKASTSQPSKEEPGFFNKLFMTTTGEKKLACAQSKIARSPAASPKSPLLPYVPSATLVAGDEEAKEKTLKEKAWNAVAKNEPLERTVTIFQAEIRERDEKLAHLESDLKELRAKLETAALSGFLSTFSFNYFF